MRVVLQRVSAARVVVDGATVGEISRGWLTLIGVGPTDTPAAAAWLADKVAHLRCFPDADGKMNLSVQDIGGGVLAVSNFTLYADAAKGRRPSFIGAARPEQAEPLYDRFVTELKALGVPVACGVFGADMQLTLTNDGPVTLVLDSPIAAPAPPP